MRPCVFTLRASFIVCFPLSLCSAWCYLACRPSVTSRPRRPSRPHRAIIGARRAFSIPTISFRTKNHISTSCRPCGAARLTGGAYIGVGPDQNFSYIAQVRPDIAFIVDIRRDNLLLHLLFKALFSLSDTRVELPEPAVRPAGARASRRVAQGRPRRARELHRGRAATDAKIDGAARRASTPRSGTFGVPLSAADLQDDRPVPPHVHRRRPAAASSRRTGRAPRSYYPTYAPSPARDRSRGPPPEFPGV